MNINELVKIFDKVWESYEEAYETGYPMGESLFYEEEKVEFMMLELTNLLLNSEFTKEEIKKEREKSKTKVEIGGRIISEEEKEFLCNPKYLVIHKINELSEILDLMGHRDKEIRTMLRTLNNEKKIKWRINNYGK